MADHPRTMQDVCDEIAAELNRIGLVITNKVTGRVIHTGSDVFNFSSHGELFHIWEFWEMLFPGVQMYTGKLKGPIREDN